MSQVPGTPRWPNVPACYGWLSLDRRGVWRLQGEPVHHAGLLHFLNQGYQPAGDGSWFVANGPQKVFVDLDYTPWIYRLDTPEAGNLPDAPETAGTPGGPGVLRTHTDQLAGAVETLFLDEEGNLLALAAPGIGLIDDRDLPALLAQCTEADGQPARDESFAALLDGEDCLLYWQGLPITPIQRTQVAVRFNFTASPRAAG